MGTMFDSKKDEIMQKLNQTQGGEQQPPQQPQEEDNVPPDMNQTQPQEDLGTDETNVNQGEQGDIQIPMDKLGDVKEGQKLKITVQVASIDQESGLANLVLI